ncbi:MerR family DNA-binding protein [Microbulbifer yueqingensis]|uniref:MerR family transcriptional regulator, copper efflux regulator n=1 Tax=Microbulbifer yueqingensis TaxID=658219 RepID=A0A1G8UU70_9GAMM|nr:MerR family DNA-binding protein [Microbulbifer yueqingensis]SDJ57097.1 MerR family transcriptional regulator, copper efflux regulator [Microbulbifer yueqingensis]
MNISRVAEATGLSGKALRYYEEHGLVVPGRGANGYREYSERDIDALHFIQRARCAGFSVGEVRGLLELYRNPARRSRDAREMVEAKLAQVDAQIEQLLAVRANLHELARDCPGNDSPECPILQGLADIPSP